MKLLTFGNKKRPKVEYNNYRDQEIQVPCLYVKEQNKKLSCWEKISKWYNMKRKGRRNHFCDKIT